MTLIEQLIDSWRWFSPRGIYFANDINTLLGEPPPALAEELVSTRIMSRLPNNQNHKKTQHLTASQNIDS
jgi:hypothetical protein